MMVQIETEELKRLRELEVLLVHRLEADVAPSKAQRILMISAMRMKMYEHLNRWFGDYQGRLKPSLLQHVQQRENRPALQTIHRQTVS